MGVLSLLLYSKLLSILLTASNCIFCCVCMLVFSHVTMQVVLIARVHRDHIVTTLILLGDTAYYVHEVGSYFWSVGWC